MKTAGIGSDRYKVSFGGHKKYSNRHGMLRHKFFYNYDTEKFKKVSLELVPVYSEGGVWKYKYDESKIEVPLKNNETISIDPEKVFPKDRFYGYRFKLITDDGKDWYDFDAGIVTDIDDSKTNISKFNIISKDTAIITKNGPMQLIFIDSESGYTNEKELTKQVDGEQAKKPKVVRNMFNRLGGKMSHVTSKLDELQKDGYSRVVFTPFTDGASSHEYWTRNAFRTSPSIGTYNDFKKLLNKSLETGVNVIADGAFVNEGLDGDHFAHLLKWGKESPYYNWFKAQGLEDGVLSLGIIPKKTEHIRYRLVNSPFEFRRDSISNKIYTMKNDGYINKQPTYIQFYDDRLVSEEQLRVQKLFSTYAKKGAQNHYEITGHNDSIYPYSFEIDPNRLKDNINEFNKKPTKQSFDIFSAEGAKNLLQFENFEIAGKKEGGFELWNGNVDVAKFNLYLGNQDQAMIDRLPPDEGKKRVEALEKGMYQVQDYAISAGRYWTKFAHNEMLKQTARKLEGVGNNPRTVLGVLNSDKFNKNPNVRKVMMDSEVGVINKIIRNNYNLKIPALKNNYQEFLMKELMDFPLESIEASRDLTAVLSSPYITKRACAKNELGMNRYDLKKIGYRNIPMDYLEIYNKTDKMYEQLFTIAKEIYDKSAVNLTGEFSQNSDVLGDYGKYVIKLYTQELTKYLIIKALHPDAQIHINDNGEMNFDELKISDISLPALGIKGNSPKVEAGLLIERIQKGLEEIPQSEKNKLAQSISKNLRGVDLNSFKIAEAIVDRTESGLGWRIDAAKDVASVDALLDEKDDFEGFWNAVIDFWKDFNKGVRNENSHAYTVAEVTDINKFFSGKPHGRFLSEIQSIQKFLEETGITTIANYFYAFSAPVELFSKGMVDGEEWNVGKTNKLQENFEQFFYSTPLEGILSSYVFSGNHDKPRLMHLLSLDMNIFYSDFKMKDEIKTVDAKTREANKNIKIYNLKIESYRKLALGLLYPEMSPQEQKVRVEESPFFDRISPKAVAMGLRVKKGFDDMLFNSLEDKDKELFGFFQFQIHKAIADLSAGKYKSTKFPSEMFGIFPIDIVINDVLEQLEYNLADLPNNKIKMDEDTKKRLMNKVLESILAPSREKAQSIYKVLTVIPGSPTDFSGDFLGMSGYETKKGNYYQQNRNLVPYDWLDDKNKGFIKTFYNDMREIAKLRSKPELAALNNGIPVLLGAGDRFKDENPKEINEKHTVALYRYNDKGSEVISIIDTKNAHPNNNYGFDKLNYEIKPIRIDKIAPKIGLMGGLTPGSIFKNAKEEDQSEYIVVKTNDEYWLKQMVSYQENGETKKMIKDTITMRANDNNVVILYKENTSQKNLHSKYVPIKWLSTPGSIKPTKSILPPREGEKIDMRV